MVALGDSVFVSHVFAFPDHDGLEDDGRVEMGPIASPFPDRRAIVIGRSLRRYMAEVVNWSDHENHGRYLDYLPSQRSFYVVRYTLNGRRYYTTEEYLRSVTEEDKHG